MINPKIKDIKKLKAIRALETILWIEFERSNFSNK